MFRRQAMITVQPYDDNHYWTSEHYLQEVDGLYPGCVSLDPFGTNRMAAEWAALDDEGQPREEKPQED